MKIEIISYGKKYNKPLDTDIKIDARCLINPYYQDSLRDLTGLDDRVSSYILLDSYTKSFIEKVMGYITSYIERIKDKYQTISIGIMCTGGKHRSVFLSEYIKKNLEIYHDVLLKHRDIYE